jgi:hypothetical protein
MDKYPLLRNGLAVGIILLFVGVAIASSINVNVVKASNNTDLVEVTTQACGIKGFGNTTVKLTRQQYHNLEKYLVEFRERLNKTTTRDEAVPIFNEAVVELNNYGLLPRGMSVKSAQTLICGKYQDGRTLNFLKKNIISLSYVNNSNCLVSGICSHCYMMGAMEFLFNKYLFFIIIIITPNPISPLWLLEVSHYEYKVLNILGVITLGELDINTLGGVHPSFGWISSTGSSGNQYWQGSFVGGFTGLGLAPGVLIYAGVLGFSGIRLLNLENKSSFFIGSALKCSIIPK